MFISLVMGEGPEGRLPFRASIHHPFVFCSPLHSMRVLLWLRETRSSAAQPRGFLLNSQGMLFPSNCVSPGNFPTAVLSPGLPQVGFICSMWGQDRDRSA